MGKYYNRKFHLQLKLDDGNIWKGMINVEADSKEELPEVEDIKGTFWFSKDVEGWHGRFNLEGISSDLRKVPNPEGFSECITKAVITNGVYLSEEKMSCIPRITSMDEANLILDNCRNMSKEYSSIRKYGGRLEDCIAGQETHYW